MQAASPSEICAPLDGVRVLDLTHHVCGSFATKVLADFGADVLKVERPGVGDRTRGFGPFPGHRPDPNRSGMFLYLNANKRGITLNLKSEQGQQIVQTLAERSEIVVTDFQPRQTEALGISYQRLGHGSMVMTSITNFGQTGPYRDFEAEEINLFGFGGPMRATGTPEREPSTYARHVALLQAGCAAALATLIAFYGGLASGRCRRVDFAIAEALLGSWDKRAYSLLAYQYTGQIPAGRLYSHSMAFGSYPCIDGYIGMAGQGDRFPRVLRMIGREDLMTDVRFATPSARTLSENIIAFDTILLEWLMQRSRAEIWRLGQAAGVLIGPVLAPGDVLADPHYRGRGFWVRAGGAAGDALMPGPPFVLHGSPATIRRSAPALGEHNADVYCCELGLSHGALTAMQVEGVI